MTDVPAIPRADLRGDPLGRRVARRLVTIPAVVLGLAMTTAALPALVTLALAVDLARPAGRRALSSVRVVLFLEAFLLAESLGVALLGLIWIATIGRPRRREDLTWPVQRFYTGMQMRSVQAIFALRFEVEGADRAAEGGPVVVRWSRARSSPTATASSSATSSSASCSPTPASTSPATSSPTIL